MCKQVENCDLRIFDKLFMNKLKMTVWEFLTNCVQASWELWFESFWWVVCEQVENDSLRSFWQVVCKQVESCDLKVFDKLLMSKLKIAVCNLQFIICKWELQFAVCSLKFVNESYSL